MVRLSVAVFASAFLLLVGFVSVTAAFSMSMMEPVHIPSSRRSFLSRAVTATTAAVVGGAAVGVQSAQAAAPEILQTEKGVKYATLKKPTKDSASSPRKGDYVAIEYTGYLADGTIFDATHGEGKKKALMFELGSNVVPEGVTDMVMNMKVGQKVQAIIPPKLAFGDKGLCLESGECLIKPKSTLVYDINLKRDALPPP